MKIYCDINVSNFEKESWHCEEFWQKVHEQDLEESLNAYFEECYSDGLDKTSLNDILRFNGDDVLNAIGYEDEENDEGPECPECGTIMRPIVTDDPIITNQLIYGFECPNCKYNTIY